MYYFIQVPKLVAYIREKSILHDISRVLNSLKKYDYFIISMLYRSFVILPQGIQKLKNGSNNQEQKFLLSYEEGQ